MTNMLKFYLHRPVIEPGSIAWQATILPLKPPMLAYYPKSQKLESLVLVYRN